MMCVVAVFAVAAVVPADVWIMDPRMDRALRARERHFAAC
jgi:hypothetical protein